MQTPPTQQSGPSRPQPTDEQHRRAILHNTLLIFIAILCTFSALGSLASPMPFFLIAPFGMLVAFILNITVIVRTALKRSPLIFYFLAGLGTLASFFFLIISSLVMLVPQFWEYQDCATHAITISDTRQCQDTLQQSVHRN